MDTFEPYHDEEAGGVLFQAAAQGRAAQGYISCALLARLGGVAAGSEDWVALYLRHRALIDAVVARRAALEGWEIVIVTEEDLRSRS